MSGIVVHTYIPNLGGRGRQIRSARPALATLTGRGQLEIHETLSPTTQQKCPVSFISNCILSGIMVNG